MAKLKVSEQEIINALCVYIAEKKKVAPEEVEIELMYDDDYGFSAESHVHGRNQVLITLNIIEALRMWLNMETDIDPLEAAIDLVLHDDEGIIANIN